MKFGVDPAATGKTRFSLQDIDACDHSLEVWKGKLKGMFFLTFHLLAWLGLTAAE